MKDSLMYLSVILAMFAVFFGVLGLFAFASSLLKKNKKDSNYWLFSQWQEQLYDSLFTTAPNTVAKKLGVDVDKYLRSCALCNLKNELKSIIILRILGYLTIGIFVILAIFTSGWAFIPVGLALALPLISYKLYVANQKLARRKAVIANELPRFLDMLQTALAIDMPVDQAIETISHNLPEMILSSELLRALADARLGVSSWQEGLERLAFEYDIDTLSDFAMDLVNAYNTGSSIIESVARKSRDTKRANILSTKERAARLTSTILFPVLIFKILPLLALLCIPVISQLNSSGWGL